MTEIEVKLITEVGVLTARYDLTQAQTDQEVKYVIEDGGGDEFDSGFVELQIGDEISKEVVREAIAILDERTIMAYGLIVPEDYMPSFLGDNQFMNRYTLEIYPGDPIRTDGG